MRVQFTPEQKLQLSEPLLSHLQDWAVVAVDEAKKEKENVPSYKKPETTEGDGAEEEEENGEAKLAKTLVEDFGAAGEAAVNTIETNNGEFSDYYIGLVSFSEKFLALPKELDADDHLALIEKKRRNSF